MIWHWIDDENRLCLLTSLKTKIQKKTNDGLLCYHGELTDAVKTHLNTHLTNSGSSLHETDVKYWSVIIISIPSEHLLFLGGIQQEAVANWSKRELMIHLFYHSRLADEPKCAMISQVNIKNNNHNFGQNDAKFVLIVMFDGLSYRIKEQGSIERVKNLWCFFSVYSLRKLCRKSA